MFLIWAAAYFAEHGIARIERIMTDNAWAYRWSLREVVADLGARQKFIEPHCQTPMTGAFDIAVITVPTPLRDGTPDLSRVETAAEMLA